jgi:lactate dehydrogenase-like 2-hydroxyacid dehydrogenase
LRGGDYVFISLPLNKYTRGLVNYDKLSLINRRGVLVNVARAEIVVKEDIRRFLLENPQFTYASDVWWNPGDMRRDADVLGLPNVIATPWVAGGYGSRLVFNHMVNEAVKNLITYLKGGEPRNVVRHEDYR